MWIARTRMVQPSNHNAGRQGNELSCFRKIVKSEGAMRDYTLKGLRLDFSATKTNGPLGWHPCGTVYASNPDKRFDVYQSGSQRDMISTAILGFETPEQSSPPSFRRVELTWW